MRITSATEAKNAFSALLREVEHGGVVQITRNGKPVVEMWQPGMIDTLEREAGEREDARALQKVGTA